MRKSKIASEDRELFRQAVDAIGNMEHSAVAKKNISKAISYDYSDAPPSVGPNDRLYYKTHGVRERTMRRLSTGKITIEDELDLHGYTVAAAQKALDCFLASCHSKQYRCIIVIHGKGYGSTHGMPILKNKINQWLRACNIVRAFCSAPSNNGGVGAALVLL